MRVMTRTRSSATTSLAIFVSLGLDFLEVVFEAVQALAPQFAIVLEPVLDGFDALGSYAGRARLGRPAPRDQARLLKNLEMLGDRRQADSERLSQLVHIALAERE